MRLLSGGDRVIPSGTWQLPQLVFADRNRRVARATADWNQRSLPLPLALMVSPWRS